MDVPTRLPLTDPRRIAAREHKLWYRELSYAIQEQQRRSQPHLKISCRYKLCNCGWRQEKFVDTVLHYLDSVKMYGRHPTRYGSSKGYDPDDSDVEWDDHIIRSYGSLAARRPPEIGAHGATHDEDYDLTDCVASNFNMYNQILGERFKGEQRFPDVEGNQQHEPGEEVNADDLDDDRGERNSEGDVGDEDNPEVHIPHQERQTSPDGDHDDSSSSSSADGENFGEGEGDVADSSDDEGIPPWNSGVANPIAPNEMYLQDAARTPLFANSRISLFSAVILILTGAPLYAHAWSTVRAD